MQSTLFEKYLLYNTTCLQTAFIYHRLQKKETGEAINNEFLTNTL